MFSQPEVPSHRSWTKDRQDSRGGGAGSQRTSSIPQVEPWRKGVPGWVKHRGPDARGTLTGELGGEAMTEGRMGITIRHYPSHGLIRGHLESHGTSQSQGLEIMPNQLPVDLLF